MHLQELIEITAEDLIRRIAQSDALGVFAVRRAKFEGWLKVELVDILIKKGYNAEPERDFVDISFDEVAIELKTVNTNYRDDIADQRTRPITKNIEDLIQDIKRHPHKGKFSYRFIIFVVFPLRDVDRGWESHLSKIRAALGSGCSEPRYFSFQKAHGKSSGVSGCLYYGKVLDPDRACSGNRLEGLLLDGIDSGSPVEVNPAYIEKRREALGRELEQERNNEE